MSKHEDDKEISSHLENQAYDEPFSAAELAASGKHHDAALDILQTVAGGRREITAEENRQVLRKIDWHLMPIMVIIYFAQFFDKQTLSFASVFGIQKDANLHGKEYSWLGSIVYLAWFPTLTFTSYLLVRLPLSIFVPGLIVAWGATLACMAAAHNFVGLLVARFILGVLECSVAPAFILIGQIWYRRSEQGWRAATWYSQNAMVNIFGSLLAYGMGHIHSKVLHSYQIIFLLTGVVTVAFGIVCFWIFPDNPVQNKFLNEDEKVIAVERLRANQQGIETKEFKWSQALEMITDLKSWGWMGLLFLISVPSGGISTFGPLIISGFGFSGANAMLLNIPFGAMQLIVICISFWLSTRFKTKSVIMLGIMVPCLIGSAMLYALKPGNTGLRLFAYYLLAAYTPITPLILSWQATNTAGHSKKTTTTAFAACGQAAGNVVGPLLFTTDQKPYYHSGLKAIMAIFCAFIVFVIIVDANLYRLNKRNAKRRVAEGKPEHIQDYSMMTRQEAETARAQELMDESNGLAVKHGEHAFEDLTDQQNSEFIYVY